GCGKTTTLRCVAGLEHPTDGEISIAGRIVSSPANGILVPPRLRELGMVFQSYAVWPHMTVRQNVVYPLKHRKSVRSEAVRKVDEVLELVGLSEYADRPVVALSGGQMQRVALARSIVYRPQLLLLDEPLSNLDAKLRASARLEIKQFQQRVGITTIYVTHDQVEAMGMGDRIAVIDGGRVRQVGTPTEIYDDPADRFVATFVGTPPMNIVPKNGGYLGFRPENFLPKDMINGEGYTEFKFRVDRSEYLGSERIVYGAMEGFDPKQVITAKLPPAHVADEWIRPGEWHPFAVRNSALRNFDKDGNRTSRH
ncbi:MAG: ABC transporter ATP-binding protein, partial [Pseudolabrys sp.]